MKDALEKAIATAGSATKLGQAIGVSGDRVRMWKHRHSLPVQFVLKIELATGVSRHDFDPTSTLKSKQEWNGYVVSGKTREERRRRLGAGAGGMARSRQAARRDVFRREEIPQ